MAIERRPRLEDGTFGEIQKVGDGVTQTDRVGYLEQDVEAVATAVFITTDDVTATAETVVALVEVILDLQAQINELKGGIV